MNESPIAKGESPSKAIRPFSMSLTALFGVDYETAS